MHAHRWSGDFTSLRPEVRHCVRCAMRRGRLLRARRLRGAKHEASSPVPETGSQRVHLPWPLLVARACEARAEESNKHNAREAERIMRERRRAMGAQESWRGGDLAAERARSAAGSARARSGGRGEPRAYRSDGVAALGRPGAWPDAGGGLGLSALSSAAACASGGGQAQATRRTKPRAPPRRRERAQARGAIGPASLLTAGEEQRQERHRASQSVTERHRASQTERMGSHLH